MLEIRRLRQIQTLVSPTRQAIVDALEAVGSCSVATLASILDRPNDRLYYHLRILEKHGLVVERPGTGRRAAVRYDLAGRPMRLHYSPQNRENADLIGKVVGSMLRDSHRSFRRGFMPGAVVRGARRNLWAGRVVGWLSTRDLARVNELLWRLHAIFAARRGRTIRGRRSSLTFVLAPEKKSTAKRGQRSRR
jgi:DNA-binding transcriptional ArsR family regulator